MTDACGWHFKGSVNNGKKMKREHGICVEANGGFTEESLKQARKQTVPKISSALRKMARSCVYFGKSPSQFRRFEPTFDNFDD